MSVNVIAAGAASELSSLLVSLSRVSDVPGCRGHCHWFETSTRGGRSPNPGRLRSLSGNEGAAVAELGAAAGRPGEHRRRHPDSCPPGSLRIPAAPGGERIPRSHFLHACNQGTVLFGASGFGAHPGRGRARCESAWVYEALPRAPTLHVGRRRKSANPAPASRLRPPSPDLRSTGSDLGQTRV